MQVTAPFGLAASPDNHDPTRGDRQSSPPAGLGLPDRDYYLKHRAALRGGARQVPRARGRACSRWPATSREAARERPRRPSSRMETRAGRGHRSTTSSLRDPEPTDHKTTVRASSRSSPRTSTGRPTSTPPGFPAADLNVAAAEVPAGASTASSPRHAGRAWKTYLKWHLLDAPPPSSLRAVRARRTSTSTAPTWAGPRR